MYQLKKFILCVYLALGFMIFITLPLLAREAGTGRGSSNEMYSGNRYGEGGRSSSNEMYSGNRFDEGTNAHSNEMYSGSPTNANVGAYRAGENRGENYGAAAVGLEGAGAGYAAPESPMSPQQAESTALYWGEVQNMEKQ